MVSLKFNNRYNGHEFQSNNSPSNVGSKIALWGSVLSTLGDTIQIIGEAIFIEENNQAEKQQQQVLENIQRQMDDLQKAQDENNISSIDIKTFNNLMERMVEKLDMLDIQKIDK